MRTPRVARPAMRIPSTGQRINVPPSVTSARIWPSGRAASALALIGDPPTASGAAPVLAGVEVMDSTAAACADVGVVFATTARGRELVKEVVTPERAMEMARAMGAEGKRVGVLFGPERAGLENDDDVQNVYVGLVD